MTIYGWVVEVRVSIAKIVVTQFGFMAAKLTTDATLIARQLQQKCRAKNKDLRMERRLTEYQWMWCGVHSGVSVDERAVTVNMQILRW